MKLTSYLLLIFFMVGCTSLKQWVVDKASFKAESGQKAAPLKVDFVGSDQKRAKIKIGFYKVAEGFSQPTDMQFVPGESDLALVLEKEGMLKWLNLKTAKSGNLMHFKVLTSSEEGLLGAAFHPNFVRNRKVYFNYVVERDGRDRTIVAEYEWNKENALKEGSFKLIRELLVVVQPYPNHNAGQLAFGPDGLLYVGFGDGGWRNDPDRHGQNPKTELGSMLTVNVDQGGKAKTQTFAIGLRNPWRFSFAPDGRLVVADVGQDLYEEISIVEKGGNYGWNIREGKHCFKEHKDCARQDLKAPIYEYPRDDGISITGGYVYTGKEVPELRDLYVFADFGTDRYWALRLPKKSDEAVKASDVFALGHWPIKVASFAKGFDGEMYALDFVTGVIYKIGRSIK